MLARLIVLTACDALIGELELNRGGLAAADIHFLRLGHGAAVTDDFGDTPERLLADLAVGQSFRASG